MRFAAACGSVRFEGLEGLGGAGLGFRFGSMAVRVCRGFGGSRFTRFLRACGSWRFGSGLRFGSRLSCKTLNSKPWRAKDPSLPVGSLDPKPISLK